MKKTVVVTMLAAFGLFYSAFVSAHDYSYYMSQPQALEKAYEKCKQTTSPECDVVNKALGDFQQLIADRQENAQDFGKKILACEMGLADLQVKLAATSPTSADYIDVSKDVDSKQQEVKTLLAVVGAMTTLD